ncbi:MAG TPA: F0F1 ATP synthase subunit epsilon [Planctomycetota bacterium]|nr:F0F1 ATP synthase subunit epsilon [Planctomycetota bacterium]
MKLTVLTPTAVAVEVEDVRRLRAADATGEFGIRPGHGDFVTVLEVSVLDYTAGEGPTRYVAVAGGILTVENGSAIQVLTDEAVAGDDLHELETTALESFRHRTRTEQAAATGVARLHVALMRRLESFLRPGPGASLAGAVPSRPEAEP